MINVDCSYSCLCNVEQLSSEWMVQDVSGKCGTSERIRSRMMCIQEIAINKHEHALTLQKSLDEKGTIYCIPVCNHTKTYIATSSTRQVPVSLTLALLLYSHS